jgi:hypothetical protein
MRLACVYLGLVACAAPQTEITSAVPTTSGQVAAPVVEPPVVEAESKMPPRNAERTIAFVRPRLRTCYERGLSLDPNMPGGSVNIHARVAADGSVRTVEVTKRVGLSSVVETCVVDQLRTTRFEPSGGATVLDVPVHFVRR